MNWAYFQLDACESEEQTMNMKQGGSWDMAQHPPMPRPKNDDGYFEQMSKVVFRAGLNWSVIEKKWPDIKRAMANFSINAVAHFDADDIDRLLKDDGMIRSAKKIAGVIGNARAVQKVQQDFGSFPNYLQALKANGEEALLKDLRKRFAFLGESSSVMFLFAVGEEMPQTLEKMHGAVQ
jgi:DNA-3-methyladenine glycosylase I